MDLITITAWNVLEFHIKERTAGDIVTHEHTGLAIARDREGDRKFPIYMQTRSNDMIDSDSS